MTPERWSRVAAILHSALMREALVRAPFVEDACGGDAELRREVESMLGRASELDDFLSKTAVELVTVGDGPRLSIGDRVGPYRIEGHLGVGGMGEVYRALDETLGRHVAIKTLPHAFTADRDRVARFAREARLLATLNHPRIGAIYGLEHIDGLPALILELVEGPTLAERFASGPMPVAEAVDVAIAIAEALEAAHDRGIIHRDIKPANIKIAPGGSVKVLDFGLAKDLECDEDPSVETTRIGSRLDVSVPGSIVGTLAYMSPEQAKGGAIDARSDLFSLGAVLYEMVTGRPAFAGRDASAVIEEILHERPVAPRRLHPAVPRALEHVILRLLEPAPDARYQTAARVRDDLVRLAALLQTGRSPDSLTRQRARHIAVAAGVTIGVGIGAWILPRVPRKAVPPGEYVQITHFADSATSPALSPDGRLLAFIRGASTFEGQGQIYVKELPDGDPVQLTSDPSEKMSPIFSPDGSSIAYTTINSEFVWDTWMAKVGGSTPRLWLSNASGLTWIDNRHVLFSEIAAGVHMRVVSADDRREGVRIVYSPKDEQGMAHRSYISPDGVWALVAEMIRPVWQRCRLVALRDGTTHRVGPDGQCTSAAWSPDGKWMYFSSNHTGTSHVWRQRFPDGAPEQISFGPGEEEGIAISPDGRSLLTSVGNRQSSIWVRDASGEREVSPEGYAFIPAIPNAGMSQPFSPDGRLVYLVRRGALRFVGPGERTGELWQTDLRTWSSEALFPGTQVISYDLSRDGRQIAFAALDDSGHSHIWVGRTDQRTGPRQLSPVEADSPRFGANGNIYYRSSQGGPSFVYRISGDGVTSKAVDQPVTFLLGVSPDDAWVLARVAQGADSSQENLAFPVAGGAPIRLCGTTCEVDWTPDAKSLVVRLGKPASPVLDRTYVLPLKAGETLPHLGPQGIRSETDLAGMRISQIVDGAVYPGGAPLVAFVRRATERNIFRIPIP